MLSAEESVRTIGMCVEMQDGIEGVLRTGVYVKGRPDEL